MTNLFLIVNLFFLHVLSHPKSFHGSDLTRVTVSSRVNEVFTQLVHVFIFAEQEENKTIRCTRIVPI